MDLEVDTDDLPAPRRAVPEGVRLARWLTASVGNLQMRRATVVLGFYRDGYWLRRFVHDPAFSGSIEQPIDPQVWQLVNGRHSVPASPVRAEDSASVNWDRVVALLGSPDALDDGDLEPGAMGPHLAALEIAASLAVGHPVDLCRAARVLPAADWRDLFSRIVSAADYV
ncbi:hypothetical protein [Streptomyces sp. NPDC055287]